MQNVIDNRPRGAGGGVRVGAATRQLRNWLIPLLVLAAALLLLNGQAVVRDAGFIEFETLVISGELEHVDIDVVRDTTGRFTAKGFLNVDLEALRDEVREIDWVHDARVRREWPATLVVEIEEEIPVATWNGEQLLNANGRLFGQASPAFANLPKLSGPEGTQSFLLTAYGNFKSALADSGFDFRELSLSERRSFELVSLDGVQVVLGAEDIQNRLQRFARHAVPILTVQGSDVRQVDFRYSNGFAIKWIRDVASVAATHDEEELDAQEI